MIRQNWEWQLDYLNHLRLETGQTLNNDQNKYTSLKMHKATTCFYFNLSDFVDCGLKNGP